MSLLDVLKPAPAIRTGGAPSRKHRLSNRPPARTHLIAKPGEDDDLQPRDVQPPVGFPPVQRAVQPSTEGETMPKGVYERKKRGEGGKAGQVATSGGNRRGPKAGKPGKVRPAGAATFIVDDCGRMEIRDGQQSIQLEADDVKRLTAFLDRTKSIRK